MKKIDYKEIALYIIIAVVIIAALVFVLGRGALSGGSYNLSVKIVQLGGVPQYPYQASHFLINITNNGQNKITNLPVGFYLNGVPLNSVNVTIPAGKNVSLLKNYTYQYAGNYSFQVVADPAQLANIADRQQAKETVSLQIVQPETADVYSSIPNGNITDTQSFTMSGSGAFTTSKIDQRYNISLFNKLFSPQQQVLSSIFQNLGGYIAYSNGAYVKYANNSSAYSGWLQGTVDPAEIELVISSFGAKSSQHGNLTYSAISNTTSVCTWYANGWTKILAYYNNSLGATCLGFSSKSYNSSENQLLVNALKSNGNLTYYQSRFLYTNITPLGSVLEYSNGNISGTNIFNNSLGFIFSTTIKKLATPLSTTLLNNPHNTCFGLIYNNGSVHVCSVYIGLRNGSTSSLYGLINSSEITSNYIINVYSIVNQSSLIAAHDNAARLMGALGINETSAIWTSGFNSGCSIYNSSLQCKFLSFNYTDNNASINVTNMFASSVRINNVNCEAAAGFPAAQINQTIAANKTLPIRFTCYNLPVPSTTAVTSYSLNINYTVNNSIASASGILNVTSPGLASEGT
jgi:hypothetical protein